MVSYIKGKGLVVSGEGDDTNPLKEDKSGEHKRGSIYTFDDGKGGSKYALVVSSDDRATEKILSIIILSEIKRGRDVVAINVGDMVRYAHCGLLTYSNRDYLKKYIGSVDSDTMERVERKILIEIGMYEKYSESCIYKDMMMSVMDKLIEKNGSDIRI